MPSSIIRARTIFTEPTDRRHWHQLDDGAVLQRDGVIAEIGPAAELITKHPGVPVLGTGRQVLLPGFVNAHHHVGLTPVQLGSPDMPLELWFVTRLVARRVDLYLDTLYSAFEMIASGITTVRHLHGWLGCPRLHLLDRNRLLLNPTAQPVPSTMRHTAVLRQARMISAIMATPPYFMAGSLTTAASIMAWVTAWVAWATWAAA